MKTKKSKSITAFKGFNKDLKCRDFQFEIGKTFAHEGEVKACNSGFHSCVNPMDVLSYYQIIDNNGEINRFAIVEAYRSISKGTDDSKIASAEITIKAELMFPEFINKAVQSVINLCAKKASSGNYAQQASSGDNAQQASSGNYAQQASSGNNAKQASSGNYAKQASSGNYAQQASSGNNAQQASSGDNAQQASSGNNAKQASSGYNCIIVNAGLNGKAKIGPSGCIVLSRWSKSEKRYRVSVGYEGENIKKDTWYTLDDEGNFVEVTA